MKASNNNLPQCQQRNKNGKRRKRHTGVKDKNAWGQMYARLIEAKKAKTFLGQVVRPKHYSGVPATKSHSTAHKVVAKIGAFFGKFKKEYSNKTVPRQMNVPRRITQK